MAAVLSQEGTNETLGNLSRAVLWSRPVRCARDGQRGSASPRSSSLAATCDVQGGDRSRSGRQARRRRRWIVAQSQRLQSRLHRQQLIDGGAPARSKGRTL